MAQQFDMKLAVQSANELAGHLDAALEAAQRLIDAAGGSGKNPIGSQAYTIRRVLEPLASLSKALAERGEVHRDK